MQTLSNNLYFFVRNLLNRDEGQDLVEYALVVALIAFGAITGMGYLATGINNAFSNVAVVSHHAGELVPLYENRHSGTRCTPLRPKFLARGWVEC